MVGPVTAGPGRRRLVPLALTASVRGERRDASLGAHDFRATIYALGARVEF